MNFMTVSAFSVHIRDTYNRTGMHDTYYLIIDKSKKW